MQTAQTGPARIAIPRAQTVLTYPRPHALLAQILALAVHAQTCSSYPTRPAKFTMLSVLAYAASSTVSAQVSVLAVLAYGTAAADLASAFRLAVFAQGGPSAVSAVVLCLAMLANACSSAGLA